MAKKGVAGRAEITRRMPIQTSIAILLFALPDEQPRSACSTHCPTSGGTRGPPAGQDPSRIRHARWLNGPLAEATRTAQLPGGDGHQGTNANPDAAIALTSIV